jgi:glycosyltransferase involved in cell wall biosynthesis
VKALTLDAKKEGKERFRKAEIQLSIGMIVKDEEATLDQCLTSLMPLLNAVTSELIITDTGSRDHTVEIAKKYTDHIIHYQWCDDFSDARNTGLREARGEWFMFLDGDEWFEDVTPIIDFFKSGECYHYGNASYRVRNYTDSKGERYRDYPAHRLYRVFPEICFVNKVHENICGRGQIKFLDAYVHHFGYVYKNQEEKEKKFQRNAGILKNILKEDPNNLRAIWELANEYYAIDEVEKAIELDKQGIELEKVQPDSVFKVSLQHDFLMGVFKTEAYQKYLDTLESIIALKEREEIDYLDFYFWGTASAYKLKQFPKVIQLGQKYLKIYEKYQGNQLNKGRLLIGKFCATEPESKEEILRLIAWSYLFQNRLEESITCFRKLDLSVAHWNIIGTHSLCFAIVWFSKNWNLIAELYDKVLSSGNNTKKQESIDCIEEHIKRSPGLRFDTYLALSKMERDDNYVYLCRLRCAEELKEQDTALECLKWFSEDQSDGDNRFSDVFYFAAKEKICLSPFVFRMKDFHGYMESILTRHPDFLSILTSYFESFPSDLTKDMFRSFLANHRIELKSN